MYSIFFQITGIFCKAYQKCNYMYISSDSILEYPCQYLLKNIGTSFEICLCIFVCV